MGCRLLEVLLRGACGRGEGGPRPPCTPFLLRPARPRANRGHRPIQKQQGRPLGAPRFTGDLSSLLKDPHQVSNFQKLENLPHRPDLPWHLIRSSWKL